MLFKLLSLVFLFLLSGCGDPIAKLINEKFPPVNVEHQRQAAIDSTVVALELLQAPNVAISVAIHDLEMALNSEALHKQGITKLRIRGNRQLLEIHGEFNRTFTEADGGDNADTRKILSFARPEITGSIDAYVGITGAVTSETGRIPELQLRLLPGVSRVEVSDLKLAQKFDVTKLGEIIADVLTKYRDNITGELTRAPFTRMTIPAAADKSIDISRDFRIVQPGTSVVVNVSAEKITSPLKLAGVAWLVDHDAITAMVQFLPAVSVLQPQRGKLDKTYGAIKGQFRVFTNSSFGVSDPPESSWVALRKDLIATGINSVVNQANACIRASGKSRQDMSAKVPMPDESAIKCSSDRNCESTRVCEFSANKDARDCSTCILSRPVFCVPRICAFGGCAGGGCTGGGCAQMGNDPVCEIAKAAQNTAYLADANLRKADCDRLKAMETAGCQAEELGKKALCDAGRVVLHALSKTGNFANIDVGADIKTDNLKICLQDFNLAPGLDQVAFNFDVTGNATADVDVKFVPLDIVGHLVCQIPWTDRRKFEARLTDSKIGVNASLKIVSADQKASLQFAVDEMTLKANISPGLTEYLMTSPNMYVSCAGLNMLRPLVVQLTPFLPALRSEISHKVDRREVKVNIPLPEPHLGQFGMRLAIDETPQSLLLVGSLFEEGTVSPSKN